MLREECAGCPNETRCGFLAAAECAQCPNALMCPAEQLYKGFHDCPTPLVTFSAVNQEKTCHLKEKFALFLRLEETKMATGVVGEKEVLEPRCLRCGSVAKQTKSYSAQYGGDDAMGIFQDAKLEPSYIHACTRCGLTERAVKLRTLKAEVDDVAVYVIQKKKKPATVVNSPVQGANAGMVPAPNMPAQAASAATMMADVATKLAAIKGTL